MNENDELKSWNLGGAAGLVGRADPNPWSLNPVHRYYVTDHLGSIRAVLNASGTVIEGRDYYPYGLTMPGRFYVEADTTREGFTGHELDKETGDYYAGARYYDPALGRWFVVDPMAEAYPGFSPFNYTLGNPVMLVDPDGMAVRDTMIYDARTSTLTQRPGGEHYVAIIDRDGTETQLPNRLIEMPARRPEDLLGVQIRVPASGEVVVSKTRVERTAIISALVGGDVQTPATGPAQRRDRLFLTETVTTRTDRGYGPINPSRTNRTVTHVEIPERPATRGLGAFGVINMQGIDNSVHNTMYTVENRAYFRIGSRNNAVEISAMEMMHLYERGNRSVRAALDAMMP